MRCSLLSRVSLPCRPDASMRRQPSRRLLVPVLGCLVAAPGPLPAVAAAAPSDADQAVETTTVVAATAAQLVHGEPLLVTATVTATAEPPATPTGSVRFSVDGGAVGEGELDAGGKAAIEVSTLTAGDHTLRAEYAPTGDFAASQGETGVAIGKAETTTSLNVRPATTVAGQSLELSVSVRGRTARAGTPTGTIEFSVLGVGPIDRPQPLNGDGAVRLTVFPPAGSHRIQARYSGDANFVASTDEVGHQTRRADTVTTIASSPNPNPPGATIDVTIDVSIVPPGDVAPFGTLQLDVNGSPLGDPIPLDGADGVELTLQSSGGARTDTIGVAYSGDENTNPSSASLRQTVQAAPGDPATPGAPSTPGTPATPGAPTTPTGPAAQPPSLVPTAPAVPVQRTGPPAAATLAVTDLRAMTSGLVASLRRRGLAALRSSVEQLAVPGPGVLSQRVMFAPAAKRRGGSRRVLVASGRQRLGSAGPAELRLRLTAAGRRHARRKTRGTVVLVTRFRPAAGAAIVVTRRVVVGGRRRGR